MSYGIETDGRFRRDVVRIALTSGLTTARQSMSSIDERGANRWLMILAFAARQGIAQQCPERGMSTLNNWITQHRDTDVVSKEDLGLAQENDRLRREIPLSGNTCLHV